MKVGEMILPTSLFSPEGQSIPSRCQRWEYFASHSLAPSFRLDRRQEGTLHFPIEDHALAMAKPSQAASMQSRMVSVGSPQPPVLKNPNIIRNNRPARHPPIAKLWGAGRHHRPTPTAPSRQIRPSRGRVSLRSRMPHSSGTPRQRQPQRP